MIAFVALALTVFSVGCAVAGTDMTRALGSLLGLALVLTGIVVAAHAYDSLATKCDIVTPVVATHCRTGSPATTPVRDQRQVALPPSAQRGSQPRFRESECRRMGFGPTGDVWNTVSGDLLGQIVHGG
jgi:hypothetical protein